MTHGALKAMFDALTRGGRTFITSVPDKGLAPILAGLEEDSRFIHVPCTREEEAVGLCAGAAFAGRRGVLLTQNSGIGNAINALTSLISFYELPLLLLVSMRGGPGERIAAQMPMGRVTKTLLSACEFSLLESPSPEAFIRAVSSDADGRIAVLASPDEWARLVGTV